MIILETLIQDIETRKRKVDEQLEKTSLIGRLSNLFKNSIDEEANMHSCRLEYGVAYSQNNEQQMREDFEKWHAGLEKEGKLEDIDSSIEVADKMQHSQCPEEQKIMRESFKECYKNLKDAWNWGTEKFDPEFSEGFIIEIARRVEPQIKSGYREMSVRPSGAYVTPPAPEKVPREMAKLMRNIQRTRDNIKEGKMSPTEMAIMTHYHLSRIHPFEDGNGRTSRMMQNLILNHYGYPATIIHKGDKINYVMNMRKADEGHKWRDKNEDFISNLSEQEKHFYDYLASRINTSIDLILDGAYKK